MYIYIILCDYTVYRYYYYIYYIIETILRAVEAPFSTIGDRLVSQVTWASGPTAGCSGHFPANYPVPPSPSPGTWKNNAMNHQFGNGLYHL